MKNNDLTSYLKFYKDFPTKGVNFVDIMPFLQNKEVFKQLISKLDSIITVQNLAVPEARGFLFATPLLLNSEKIEKVVPFRKKGKLPFAGDDLQHIEISKEYGTDKLFFRKSDLLNCVKEDNVIKVAILDDILATGGTALGIANKLQELDLEENGNKYEVEISEFIFIGEIDFLKGRELLEKIAPVRSVFHL